jgi:hypothetical protein
MLLVTVEDIRNEVKRMEKAAKQTNSDITPSTACPAPETNPQTAPAPETNPPTAPAQEPTQRNKGGRPRGTTNANKRA